MAFKPEIRAQDPIQGHDVVVNANPYGGTPAATAAGDASQLFENAFTDIMFKIVNQTETYLALNSRVPRYLDGEIVIVWSCNAGVLSMNFIKNTFGGAFRAGLKAGRTSKIARSQRFSLTFSVNTAASQNTGIDGWNTDLLTADTSGTAPTASDLANGLESSKYVSSKTTQLQLIMCRCDTLSFGVQSGKGYAVNSWQGTAEGLKRLNAKGEKQTS